LKDLPVRFYVVQYLYLMNNFMRFQFTSISLPSFNHNKKLSSYLFCLCRGKTCADDIFYAAQCRQDTQVSTFCNGQCFGAGTARSRIVLVEKEPHDVATPVPTLVSNMYGIFIQNDTKIKQKLMQVKFITILTI
jgi:hypothetical protein